MYGVRDAGRAKNASLTFLRKMEEHNVSKAYTEKVKARADAKAIETKIAADAAIGAAKKELEDHEGPQDKAVAAPDTTQASTIDWAWMSQDDDRNDSSGDGKWFVRQAPAPIFFNLCT